MRPEVTKDEKRWTNRLGSVTEGHSFNVFWDLNFFILICDLCCLFNDRVSDNLAVAVKHYYTCHKIKVSIFIRSPTSAEVLVFFYI